MMSPSPFVSIITPIYNAAPYLEEAVGSVLAQTYKDWDLWLSDDGSKDGSRELALNYAALYPDRIHFLEHENSGHRGVCQTRNAALERCTGQYVAFLDADDVWFPNKLAEQVAIANRYPEAGLIYGRSEYWYDWTNHPKDRLRNEVPGLAEGDRLYFPPSLLVLTYPLGPAGAPCPSDFLVRRDALGPARWFDEGFLNYEDQGLLAKLYLAAPVFVAENCWDRYRRHETSSWSTALRDGTEDRARQSYFEWLGAYLHTKKVTDAQVWSAFDRATWRYRHPIASEVLRIVRGAARRVRSALG